MNRKIIRLCCLFSILFIIVMSFVFIPNNFSNSEVYTSSTKSALIENGQQNKSHVKIVAKGKHIRIESSDLIPYVERAKLSSKQSEKKIVEYELQYLIKRETLFYEAQKKGFLCNKSEIKTYIDEQKKIVDDANNYNEFCEYLKITGTKEKEYWDDQYFQAKKDLSVSNYLNSIKEEIAEKNHLKFYPTYVRIDVDSSDGVNTDYEKLEKIWRKYYNNFVKELIKKECVIIY